LLCSVVTNSTIDQGGISVVTWLYGDQMVAVALAAFFVSWLACVMLITSSATHAQSYGTDKPQRFHIGDVSRLGGVAVACGLLGATALAAVLPITNTQYDGKFMLSLAIAVTPAFLAGLAEDMWHGLKPRWRLAATLSGAALALWLLNLHVPRLGVDSLESLWAAWPWLGMFIAFLAVGGTPHAFNLIDGYNGLAGFVCIGICLAIAHVGLQVGDRQLTAIAVATASASAGFLVWNYPQGKLFAGDGGAYLWGALVAVLSLLLVQRHASVSPLFPLLLVIYPVWETVFSIYRKAARGQAPGLADALHFHQLVHRRIVRHVDHDDTAVGLLKRNNRTSPYLWAAFMFSAVPAVLWWDNTPILAFFCVLFAVSYVFAYRAIVNFKVPKAIRKFLDWA
jgi:UDP-N-acetylmuramyl pentapeptide phosphotransferase/UDP-N-acetylglucosamine-1-phosphate transferase